MPESWLNYACLDVDVLADLRDALEEVLEDQGKLEYARQEFAYLCSLPPADPAAKKAERWRKTKGRNTLRSVPQLTALRNLWFERDKLAQKKDIDSKALLSDAALVEAAQKMPRNVPAIMAIPGFRTRLLKREGPRWVRAIVSASRGEDPAPYTIPATAPPPLKAWETKRPISLEILSEVRKIVQRESERLNIPAQNIISADCIRRLCWDPPEPYSQEALLEALRSHDVRPWQVEILAPDLHEVFQRHLG